MQYRPVPEVAHSGLNLLRVKSDHFVNPKIVPDAGSIAAGAGDNDAIGP